MNPVLKIVGICLLLWLSAAARPKQKGLIPGTAGSFQANAHEEILLYYDLDRDHKIDIVTKSLDRSTAIAKINFYIWNPSQGQYVSTGFSQIDNYVALSSAMATTFKKSTLKLILTFINQQRETSIVIRPLSCTSSICELSQAISTLEISIGLDPAPPTLISLDGSIALMYQTNHEIYALTFTDELTYTIVTLKQAIGGQFDPSDYSHSSVGDYDGDCLTDLVLLVQSGPYPALEFYLGSNENSYTYSHMVLIQQPLIHFAIQDINYDGKNDLVLLLSTGTIEIHYNTNPNKDSLCLGIDTPYDFTISQDKAMQIQKVELGKNVSPDAVLLFGDYDNDGYEDLTLTQIDGNTGRPKAVLLHNQACLGQECGTYNPTFIAASSTLNLRTFIPVDIPSLPEVVTRLSFLDFYEDGTLDIMAEIQASDSIGRFLTIQPIYNNYGYDAFFMRISLLAPRDMTEILSNTEYIGGCTSFYVTLLSGELAPRTGSQMSQTGQILQLPTVRFGLGRTNNYLQTLTVNLPRKVSNPELLSFHWSPIVPNSDILIVPPASDDPQGQWILTVMIQPTAKMGPVILFLIAVLVILALVIARLSKKESLEDKESQASFYTLLS